MKKLLIFSMFLLLIMVSCTSNQYRGYNDRERIYSYENRREGTISRNYKPSVGTNEHRIDAFQSQAFKKIETSRRRGVLGKSSYNRLIRKLNQIEQKENRFMRNGRLSNSETRQLVIDLENLDKMISHESRNRRVVSRRF